TPAPTPAPTPALVTAEPTPAPVAATPLPPRAPCQVRHRVRRPADRRLDRRTAMWLGIGCPAITAINIAIEPVPADPQAPVPVAASLLFLAFTAAVVATSVFAARRETKIFPYAVAAGVGAVVLTVTCPMSGHHAGIGWWWYTQMALSAGFLAVSAGAWRRHRAAG
ncbi:MAG: hypothetical protein ACRD2W_01480, partial [Acidimicrobiales bacterium]